MDNMKKISVEEFKNWAKGEVDTAIDELCHNNERPEVNAVAKELYLAAGKAVECFADMKSSPFTALRITERLLRHKPLTAIKDTIDIWEKVVDNTEVGDTTYQCKRYSGLFKVVDKTGKVHYNDVSRVVATDPDGITFQSSLATDLVNEMFPITFPYNVPMMPFRVSYESFLFDQTVKNSDFDTVALYTVITPRGAEIEVNKFFAYGKDDNPYEITEEQFNARKKVRIQESEPCQVEKEE